MQAYILCPLHTKMVVIKRYIRCNETELKVTGYYEQVVLRGGHLHWKSVCCSLQQLIYFRIILELLLD